MKRYCCANCDCDIKEAGYYRLGKKIYCSEECVLEDLDVRFEWLEDDEEADRERHDLSA